MSQSPSSPQTVLWTRPRCSRWTLPRGAIGTVSDLHLRKRSRPDPYVESGIGTTRVGQPNRQPRVQTPIPDQTGTGGSTHLQIPSSQCILDPTGSPVPDSRRGDAPRRRHARAGALDHRARPRVRRAAMGRNGRVTPRACRRAAPPARRLPQATFQLTQLFGVGQDSSSAVIPDDASTVASSSMTS